MSQVPADQPSIAQLREMGDATRAQRNELRHLLETKRYPKNWRDNLFADVRRDRGLSNARAIGALNFLRNQPALDGRPVHITGEQRDELLALLRIKVCPKPWADRIRRQIEDGTLSYDQAELDLASARRMPAKEFIPAVDMGVKVPISTVPDGQYAITGSDARVRHYKISTSVGGVREVKHLTGPRRLRIIRESAQIQRILEQIAADPAAAAKLYGETARRCARERCNRPLHDPDQPGYPHGYGPDCWAEIVAARKIRDHKATIPDE